jgi:hypothetical protein
VSGGVMLGSFARVMHGVRMMAMRRVRVVCGFLVVALFMMPGSLAMVVGSLLVMLGGLVMMLRDFLRHDAISSP